MRDTPITEDLFNRSEDCQLIMYDIADEGGHMKNALSTLKSKKPWSQKLYPPG